MAEKKKRRKKAPRQNWNPSFPLRILYRVWRIALSALKVATGAVATVLLIGIVCAFVFISLLGQYLQEDIIPQAQINLENYDMEKTSYVYYFDENGNVQILQQLATTADRRWVAYEDIPEDLINAAIAIEDKRFYEHQGVDWITTIKACANMFFGGGASFGGSTLTQQLVKNILLMDDETANDVTVQRKLLEIFRALQFEKTYDKELVIEYYMNTVYFGNFCYGVKSAAEYYFGKELQDMNTAEFAALIGITNNPSMFNPYSTNVYGIVKGDEEQKDYVGADRNQYRQKVVLTQMYVQGWITEEAYMQAYEYELVYKKSIADEDKWNTCKGTVDEDGNVITEGCGYEGPVRDLVTVVADDETVTYYCPECDSKIDIAVDASQGVYSWFVDTVIEDVAKELAAKDGVTEWNNTVRRHYVDLICRSGYHIYTTYNAEAQAAADKIYTDPEQVPAVKNSAPLASGMVIIDNKTGDIAAIVGDIGEKTVSDALNHATDEGKQIGSSIKPLTVYAPAFDAGLITPATIIDDLPLYYTGTSANPYPDNYDGIYRYQRTVWRGIINSYNTIAANTLELMGTQYSFNFGKNKLRLDLTEEYTTSGGYTLSDLGIAALSMGGLTWGLTVREVACAYATFANNGIYREGRTFTLVLDDSGNVVVENEQDTEQILSEKAVNYINYCLDSVVSTGTGTTADMYKELGMDVAGKTGTTNANKDQYFAGYTGHYTAAVWCGFKHPERIILSGSTASPATRLWKKVMLQVHQGLETIPLYAKDDMIKVTICLESGKLASETCKNDIRTEGSNNVRYETVMVYPEDAPTELCDKHISVDYCTSGNGVANAYCHNFSRVGAAIIREKSLVKMTQTRLDELKMAYGKGLHALFSGDEYIYLVDYFGNPQPFFGFDGDINEGLNVPYQVCTVHTEQSWEYYKLTHPWIDGGSQNPGDATENPGDGTENPGDGTENPGDGTENPGGGTENPGGGTENPGDGTENGDNGSTGGNWLDDLLDNIFGN